jgi:hypothetical protein
MQKANRTLRKKVYLNIGKETRGTSSEGHTLHNVVGIKVVRNPHGARGPNHIAISVKQEINGGLHETAFVFFCDEMLTKEVIKDDD